MGASTGPPSVPGAWSVLSLVLDLGLPRTLYVRTSVAAYAASIVARPTSVELQPTETPANFALERNYPNPFNVSTTIRFSLPAREMVRLTLYDLAGQQVVTLVRDARQAGTHTVTWDGMDDRGRALASGVYLCRLQADDQREARKLLLLR
jgi:hypothetical protein